MEIAEGTGVLLIFLGMSSPIVIIGLFYYLKKRLEHKQIMAAIEKGTSLSELRPVKPAGPVWIKSLTAGIALLIIAAGVITVASVWRGDFDDLFGFLIVSVILLAFGISWLIRGLLQRKAQIQNQNTESGAQKER